MVKVKVSVGFIARVRHKKSVCRSLKPTQATFIALSPLANWERMTGRLLKATSEKNILLTNTHCEEEKGNPLKL